MGTIYVAKSNRLGKWGSDVGVSKHLYKIGYSEAPVKALVEAGWAGESDWALVKKETAEGIDEEAMLARLAQKEKMIDPDLYPKLKGARGIFKVPPTHVEDHIVVSRAMAGYELFAPPTLKPADFALYLIHNALK
ncbi:MAG: hypothetical protein ACHQF3_02495 [Alphaproteobacteria bacterium]